MAFLDVEYHVHARVRMAQRKIGDGQVLRTLNDPHRVYPGHSGRTVAERDTEAGNVLRVVYDERDGGTTAYVWTVIRIGRKRQ